MHNLAFRSRKVDKIILPKHIRKRVWADHLDALALINNNLSNKSQGPCDEVEGLHQQALVGWENHLGADHLNTFMSINNLASVYQSQSR